MTCHEVKELIPEILRSPGRYPEAEEHIHNCSRCREEMVFIKSLMAAETDPHIQGNVENVQNALNHAVVSRHFRVSTGIAAVLIIMLSFVFIMNGREDIHRNYAFEDSQDNSLRLSADETGGAGISDEDIALYLIENDELQNLNNITYKR